MNESMTMLTNFFLKVLKFKNRMETEIYFYRNIKFFADRLVQYYYKYGFCQSFRLSSLCIIIMIILLLYTSITRIILYYAVVYYNILYTPQQHYHNIASREVVTLKHPRGMSSPRGIHLDFSITLSVTGTLRW